MDNVFHAQSVNMLSCDINSLLYVSCSLSTCIKSIFGRGPGGNRMGGGGGGVSVRDSQFSISGKGPATSPSTKLVLKYIELR